MSSDLTAQQRLAEIEKHIELRGLPIAAGDSWGRAITWLLSQVRVQAARLEKLEKVADATKELAEGDFDIWLPPAGHPLDDSDMLEDASADAPWSLIRKLRESLEACDDSHDSK